MTFMLVCVRVHAWVRAYVCLSHFYIYLYLSFSYEDIFIKFAESDYGYENISVENFVLFKKNKMAQFENQ